MGSSVMSFVAVTSATGVLILWSALRHFQSADPLHFVCFLGIAALASTLKVRLPGMESTMSVHFLLVLLGAVELSLGETLILGCTATLVQSVWRTRHRPELIKVGFNVLGMSASAIYLTYRTFHASSGHSAKLLPVFLLLTACTYFVANTLPVSIVIALSTRSSFRTIWSDTSFWSLPYYLLGAGLVCLVSLVDRQLGWPAALVVFPVMYWFYRSYHRYLRKLEAQTQTVEIKAQQVEAEKRHAEELCELHLRTIEGLALAISARDHNTHTNLHRIRTYAVELATELGLCKEDLDALKAAALLQDIGKLAVPDHIFNKTGTLTPAELAKMQIHPEVGSEILERVSFPYPVAPTVRSHHERWDGQGYPDGLRAQEIPIGARILAVVDTLVTLTSDRQERGALSTYDALQVIVEDSGKAFDPAIVALLQSRWQTLEKTAELLLLGPGATNTSAPAAAGTAPSVGSPHGAAPGDRQRTSTGFLASIASARQEAHTLFELSQDLGNSLSLDETLSVVAVRLRRLIPHCTMGVFLQRKDDLVAEFTRGEHAQLLGELSIPLGAGLCGRVAAHMTPLVNGDPRLEHGASGALAEDLQSLLAVPLEGVTGLIGVLALYREEANSFTAEHLRILEAVTARVAHFIENALKFREAEYSAVVDYLTELSNARGLSLHLEQELTRYEQDGTPLAVLLCDLDGFKQVNDLHGHLAGDRVLKRFAQLARETLREGDFFARLGGDEFVIVAPSLDASAVHTRACLLELLAQQAAAEICGFSTLSVSVGAAWCPADGRRAENLLAQADLRMYSVKAEHHSLHHRGQSVPDPVLAASFAAL